jgi:hypothetical protein
METFKMSSLNKETNYDDIVSRLYKLASEFVPELKVNDAPISGNLDGDGGRGGDGGGGGGAGGLKVRERYIKNTIQTSSSSKIILELKSRSKLFILTFAAAFAVSFSALYFTKPDFVMKKKTKDYIDVYEIVLFKVFAFSLLFGLVAAVLGIGASFYFKKK